MSSSAAITPVGFRHFSALYKLFYKAILCSFVLYQSFAAFKRFISYHQLKVSVNCESVLSGLLVLVFGLFVFSSFVFLCYLVVDLTPVAERYWWLGFFLSETVLFLNCDSFDH